MKFLGVLAFGAGAFLIVVGVKGGKLSEVTSIGLGDLVPF